MNKIELLAPAGNLEKLKMAILYGADAVYFGGEEFGLRASADNFTPEEMREGVEFAHSMNRKAFVTINFIPHDEDMQGMEDYIRFVTDIKVDAAIVSDPGVISLIRKTSPELELHLSTQANNTNWRSAEFWYEQGIKRIVLARELSFHEISEIRKKVPQGLELELFVHGSMCISYSGRCLLSSYMAGRDPNRGLCAHPCRWNYRLVEEKRPGEYYPVYENERGTFIFNSKDLCLIEYIPQLLDLGVSSLKIEGRMKSSFYVATVVKAYREAIDNYCENPGEFRFNPEWLEEMSKASHREYTTGFMTGKTTKDDQVYDTTSYIRDYDFVGMVKEFDEKTGIAKIEQRNRMYDGEQVEVVLPQGPYFVYNIHEMKNEDGEAISVAPHPQMTVFMKMDKKVVPFSMLRRKSGI